MLFLHHTFSPLLSFVFLSHTHTHHRVISTNLEEVEELNAHNYTSIQTYVSQSQMPSMCEMGVTPLEVSLFVKCVCACVSQHFGYHPLWSQWLCNIPPLLIISSGAFACRAYCTSDSISNNPRLMRGAKQIPPPLADALVNVDGFVIPPDSSRWAVH